MSSDTTVAIGPSGEHDYQKLRVTTLKQLRTVVENPITGTFSSTGLNIEGRITEVALNAITWTALPATPLTDRNALTIQNQTGTEIKLHYDSATVGYVGVKVGPNSERYYDITDNVILYAKSAAGTPTIIVEEIS